MALPFFAIGPSLTVAKWTRWRHQSRREVRLTAHRANPVMGTNAAGQPILGPENFYITVTNASHDREIVVTHMWIETTPPLHIHDPGLPVRLRYSAPWETIVPVDQVPGDPELVPWLARARLAPDDKTVKGRPTALLTSATDS